MAKTLSGAFNNIVRKIEKAQTITVKNMSEDTKETMEKYTPVDTGTLLESLDITSITKDRFVVEFQNGYHTSLKGESVYIPLWLNDERQIEGWYKATGQQIESKAVGFIDDYNKEVIKEIKSWYVKYMASQGINAK